MSAMNEYAQMGSLAEVLVSDLRLLLFYRTLLNNHSLIHYKDLCSPSYSDAYTYVISNICHCSWCMNSFSDFWNHRIFSQTQPRNLLTRHLFCRYCALLSHC